MLKHQHLHILWACSLLPLSMFISCNNSENKKQDIDSIWVKPQEQETITSLDPISYRNTSMLSGHRYTYEYKMESIDTLPIIINADGAKYYDNAVNLTIWRDDTVKIFHKVFLKKNFTDYVSNQYIQKSGLVGFSYNPIKEKDQTALYFLATIGDPDESAGVNFPIEIRISTEGSISMKKAEDIETEPLQKGLNEEPKI